MIQPGPHNLYGANSSVSSVHKQKQWKVMMR